MSSSVKIYLSGDIVAGVYQSLQTGDTVSHVGIFDPALRTVNLLSGSTPPPPPYFPVWISILYTRIQCVGGGCGVLGLRQITHLPQSPFYRWFCYKTSFCISFYESYLSRGRFNFFCVVSAPPASLSRSLSALCMAGAVNARISSPTEGWGVGGGWTNIIRRGKSMVFFPLFVSYIVLSVPLDWISTSASRL